MKRFAFGVFVLLLFSSCGMRHARAVMDDVETYMQEAPDSARRVLEALPRHSHRLPWQHARYCLLLSSALDRSGVDVQDDSLARYAAQYYGYFGRPDKQFYSLYYLGRVHENRGDRQSAMDAFVKAETIKSERVSPRFRSALEMHMGAIYSQIYEFDRAVEANQRAAEYARQAGWWSACGEALIQNARIHTTFGRLAQADSCRRILDTLDMGGALQIQCAVAGYDSKALLAEGESASAIERFNEAIIQEYQDTPSLIPWEDLAHTYIRSGSAAKALSSLQKQAHYHDIANDANYFSLRSEVLDSLGDSRGSLEAYKRYVAISDSVDLTIFHQDTKFLKERHAWQVQSAKRKTVLWIISVVSAVIIGLFARILFRRRKEKEHLQLLYVELQQEYQDLQALPAKMESISHEAAGLLGDRLKVLAHFFTGKQPASLDLIAPQLETLSENRKELLESIGLLLAVYRPDFVVQLIDNGLTPAECGYCCLLALGLRNAEVSEVINREGVNNINSAIRKKLHLETNSAKLGTVLKGMMDNSGQQ